MNAREIILPLSGFFTATVLLSSLSSFMMFIPYFSSRMNVSPDTIIYFGTLFYFAGMPFGKILGRFFKFHKNTVFSTFSIILLISFTLFLMPFIGSLVLLIFFRFLQGMATILNDIFSISYSYIFNERTRVLANTISISGVPSGVALGSSLSFLANMNIFFVYSFLGTISLLISIPFIYLLHTNKERLYPLKIDGSGTTLKNPITWIMGFMWMSIAGFNLVLASIIPAYLSIYDPMEIGIAMTIFGVWGAITTIFGGLIAYFLYGGRLRHKSLFIVTIIGYTLSIPGFILFAFSPRGDILYLSMFLIMMEALVIAIIFTLPRLLYKEGYVAKGTWEFSLIGSTGHIIAPLLLLPLAFMFGYGFAISLIIIFPVYGIITSIYLLKYIKKHGK